MSESATKSLGLGFKRLDPIIALGERGCHIRGLEPLWDMLRTVRIPSGNGEQDHLLEPSPVVLRRHALATTPTKVLAAGSMWRRLNAGPQSRDESAYATGIGFGPNHRAPRASR